MTRPPSAPGSLAEGAARFAVGTFLDLEVADHLLREAVLLPSAVGWVAISPYNGWPWITAAGSDADLVRVVQQLRDTDVPGFGTPRGISVPVSALSHMGEGIRPARVDDWTWWSTSDEPPRQAAEGAVQRIDDHSAGITDLLRTSASAYLRPGDDRALAWYGILGAEGPISCAAVEEHRPGVPHLASVATHPDHRGRGLAAAVCAFVTRRVLQDGASAVTLAMMSDNTAAASVYRRLGFAAGPRFASGWLPGRRSARRRDGGDGAAVCG